MNKAWSDQNKEMQALLKKATFEQGIEALLSLRASLENEMLSWREKLTDADYSAFPFPGAKGYHSKTVAYSIWHIMRIEDIVVHSLILNENEVLFSGGFAEKIRSPIITTGNELEGEQIAAFSQRLNVDALYAYARAVRESTDGWLKRIKYEDLKRRFTEEDQARLRGLHVVSPAESADWLIPYWCGKDVAGLIKMPLSRHWIMHVEAADRIIAHVRG